METKLQDVVLSPSEQTATINSQRETVITTNSDKDAPIPLFKGSKVFVSKADLAKLYVPISPIYTSRVADLVIGKEKLKGIALGDIERDEEVFQAIIIDVKLELKSEASANTTPIPETDAGLASFAAAYLSDDDTMAIRKPYTLPKILDGKFYKNIQPNQKTPGAIQATCTSCYGLISGTTKSTGNFLSHIKRRHKELLPLCQLYCQAKSNMSSSASVNCKPVIINTMPTSQNIMEHKPVPPPLPQSYATTSAHMAVPMSLSVPLSMPVSVQSTQMMALMHQHHRQQSPAMTQLQAIGPGHGSLYISKDY